MFIINKNLCFHIVRAKMLGSGVLVFLKQVATCAVSALTHVSLEILITKLGLNVHRQLLHSKDFINKPKFVHL